ncbi:MAG: class I fructose-bisphosphate aldolase [Patescibacteria group bacterium]|jgi:fructose-bisphosphate aldolase class I
MDKLKLNKIVKQILVAGKGILAADESIETIAKRFERYHIRNVEEMREAYREMLFTSPKFSNYISGVILFDEQLRETTSDGRLLRKVLKEQGVLIGCKIDKGLAPMPRNKHGEMQTKGLEGLAERMQDYADLGVTFVKWRAVFSVGKNLPSNRCIQKNGELLATYAKIAQEAGIVPIVEPEVLGTGNHNSDECYESTVRTLRGIFDELVKRGVDLRFIFLKPNMIVPGSESREKIKVEKVANLTVACLKEVVPKIVPGIVFLSGGQTEKEACANMNAIALHEKLPWVVTYSFGRALQNSTLAHWRGIASRAKGAQKVFEKRAHLTSLAQQGKYSSKLEK